MATRILNQPVSEGDKILVKLPREHSDIPPEPVDLDIRYEDAEVIVINKPPGMLTHPTARERTGTLLAGVAYHLQGQGAVPHSVHRLDRDTSGVVMFAKHAHIHHLFDIALRNERCTVPIARWFGTTRRSTLGKLGSGASSTCPSGWTQTDRLAESSPLPDNAPLRTTACWGGPSTLARYTFAWRRAARTKSVCISPRWACRWWAIRCMAQAHSKTPAPLLFQFR